MTRAILGAIVGILVAGGIIGFSRFSFEAYKPRVEAALTRAIGRQVVIHGRMGLGFSLHPTIALDDVTIANPPGFSRPDMATIGALNVQLALLPLIHRDVSIGSLILEKPDILLERNGQGQDNWQLAPTRPPSAAAPSQARAPSRRFAFSLTELRIENGRIAYRDDRTGHVAAADVRQLTLTGAGADAPMKLDADAVVNGLPVTVNAQTGSLAAIQAPIAGKPWPISGTLTAAGAKLTVQGGAVRPLEGQGYNFALDATVPDLAALRPLVPNAKLPALHDVTLAAHVADSGGPIPAISELTLHAGAGDLAPLLPGVTVTQASFSAPALDQPIKAELTGSLSGSPISFSGTVGPVSKLLTGQPAGPFPIDIAAKSGASSLSAKGGIADPAHLSGMDLAVQATTPDLAALSGLAGGPLPNLTNVSFSGQVRDLGGLPKGIALTGAKFTSAQGDLAGDLSVVPGKPPSIKGKLISNRMDLDAMQAALAHPATVVAKAPSNAKAPPPPRPAPATRSGHVIPDTPLPLNELHAANADLQLTISALTIQGETWRNVAIQASLDNGRVKLDPFKATLPLGTLDAAITADASQANPPVSLRLSAPAIGVKPLLAALGQPAFASGTADIQADLHGAGASPHAIASNLDGTLSLTMSGGQIDTALLEKLLGPAIARVNPAGLLVHGGASEIRCLAARISARNGQATLSPFVLSSNLVTVAGTGTMNLGAETLDLHLHPQGRIGGTAFEVPLTIKGSFADPHAALNDTGAAAAGIEAVIGALAGKKLPGGLTVSEPSCPAAIAEARGQPAPPAAKAQVQQPQPQKLPNAGALLRQLLR